jgi:hypothetical protein
MSVSLTSGKECWSTRVPMCIVLVVAVSLFVGELLLSSKRPALHGVVSRSCILWFCSSTGGRRRSYSGTDLQCYSSDDAVIVICECNRYRFIPCPPGMKAV